MITNPIVILITMAIILSAVMDWELVCERKELRATAQAIFMTGVNNFNFLIIIMIVMIITIIVILTINITRP